MPQRAHHIEKIHLLRVYEATDEVVGHLRHHRNAQTQLQPPFANESIPSPTGVMALQVLLLQLLHAKRLSKLTREGSQITQLTGSKAVDIPKWVA